jgi:hypothetical protein
MEVVDTRRRGVLPASAAFLLQLLMDDDDSLKAEQYITFPGTYLSVR